VIHSSDRQWKKHFEQTTSTELGITMDLSDEDENAEDSIRFSDDGLSNVTDSSESQSEKQFEQRISI
jgi:hypothetical protein